MLSRIRPPLVEVDGPAPSVADEPLPLLFLSAAPLLVEVIIVMLLEFITKTYENRIISWSYCEIISRRINDIKISVQLLKYM